MIKNILVSGNLGYIGTVLTKFLAEKNIKDNSIIHFKIKTKDKPCRKLNSLDIGWGGGLLSEPMSKLGASVTGIDASNKNINIAKQH